MIWVSEVSDDLRKAFLRRLTVDSDHHDVRRKDFNQALFDPDHGWAVFTGTNLDMIMRAFDDAVKDLARDT